MNQPTTGVKPCRGKAWNRCGTSAGEGAGRTHRHGRRRTRISERGGWSCTDRAQMLPVGPGRQRCATGRLTQVRLRARYREEEATCLWQQAGRVAVEVAWRSRRNGAERRVAAAVDVRRNQTFSRIRPDTVNPGPKPRHSTRVVGLMAFSSNIAFIMCGMVAEDMLPFS